MNRPVLQALVLADHIYRDMLTGKGVIAGTFNSLKSVNFPTVFARTTFAYMSLTDFLGKVELALRYVDLNDHKVLMECPVKVESANKLGTVEVIVEVPQFPMPHPGPYAFDVVCNDELLGSLRIHVDQVLTA